MSYRFHKVRRDVQRTFRLSEAELALFESVKVRLGYTHDNHLIQDLLLREGTFFGAPEFANAALAEQSPQESILLAPLVVSWDNLHKWLCSLVRAAKITAPNEVPLWALQVEKCTSSDAQSLPESVRDEPAPTSKSVPRKVYRAAFKAAVGRPVGHVKRSDSNVALCGIKLAELNLAEGSFAPCRKCLRMEHGSIGAAA